jgi:hypothetical protein
MSLAANIDDDLCHARIQLRRALRAESQCPNGLVEYADIIDEILSRIELLELARLALHMFRAIG